MPDTEPGKPIAADQPDYDAVIVGASLAGCATAILLGRAGARVALVEKQPDPQAFKRICSHFIQASAVPTIERLGLLDPILEAGGLRSRLHAWTPWGWIEPRAGQGAQAVNLRREVLDPLMREAAAAVPGVYLMLGQAAERLLRDGDGFGGVVVHDGDGGEAALGARLVVGADGRDSPVAALAGVDEKTTPARAHRLRRLLRGPAAGGLAGRLVLAARPRLGSGLPDRFRPDVLRGDADQGTPARIQTRPGGGSHLLRRRHSRGAADPRRAPRRPGPRQARHAQPGAGTDRARVGARRRRGARDRPAVRRRLRLGAAVRRMAGRHRRARPARRGAARARPQALPAPAPAGAARPRLLHPRLRDRAAVPGRRTDDVRGRRARSPHGGRVRGLRDRQIKPARMFATLLPRAVAVNARHAIAR